MKASPDASGRDPGGAGEAHRAGFVAIVGLPNVGKSTLLNRFVACHLAIVTPKAQTTRKRLAGIYSDARHQAVFVDTPGLLEPRYLLQRSMQEEAERAREEADVVLYVADAGYEPSLDAARGVTPAEGVPHILCLNKADRRPRETMEELVGAFRDAGWREVVPTVATRGEGTEELLAAVLRHLPPSPALYPQDQLATASVREIVAELVRESCLENLSQEVPYAVAIRVDAFEEKGEGEPTYIAATLFVERASQKGIVIGKGGSMIRRIGTEARGKVEAFLDGPVYLDLRVKVLANWRKSGGHLRLLGFPTPSEER